METFFGRFSYVFFFIFIFTFIFVFQNLKLKKKLLKKNKKPKDPHTRGKKDKAEVKQRSMWPNMGTH